MIDALLSKIKHDIIHSNPGISDQDADVATAFWSGLIAGAIGVTAIGAVALTLLVIAARLWGG